MREVNESWHVLSDPTRRRAYDAQRRGDAARRSTSSTASWDTGARRTGERGESEGAVVREGGDDDLVDVLPPMRAFTAGVFGFLPWAVLLVVLGLIFVITAYAGGSDDPPAPQRPPDAAVGECLDVASGPSTTVVSCAGAHEFRVVERVVSVSECPAGSEGRRFASDGMFDCVVPGTGSN